MPRASDVISAHAANLKTEIKAIEQSVVAAQSRLDESIRRANDAVEKLEQKSDAPQRRTSAANDTLLKQLEKAQRNAAKVEQDGKAALAQFRKKADTALASLKRRLKLVEEKLAARH